MPSFNLATYLKKTAANIPNGQSVSNVPNGSGLGQGVMLSNGNPQGIPGEGAKPSLKNIIGEMLLAANKGADKYDIALIAKKAVSADIPEELSGNDNAMSLIIALGRRAKEGQNFLATDPETGKSENSLLDIANMIIREAGWEESDLIAEAEQQKQMEEMGGSPEGMNTPGEMPQMTATAQKSGEEDPTGIEKEKKKKGNPFKVLMGRVQKLLDHGVDGRSEVAKAIMRQKGNRWERETVEKAYDIVKERNVREERKKQKEASFNLARYLGIREAQITMADTDQKTQKRPSPYDMSRKTSHMSFMELISRLQYLEALAKSGNILLNENMTESHIANTDGAESQADSIRAELSKRGYDEAMIDSIFHIPPTRIEHANYQGESPKPE